MSTCLDHSVANVIAAQEAERLRRACLDDLADAAESTLRTLNARRADGAAEAERIRRLSEGPVSKDQDSLRISAAAAAAAAAWNTTEARAKRAFEAKIAVVLDKKVKIFSLRESRRIEEAEQARIASEPLIFPDVKTFDVLTLVREELLSSFDVKAVSAAEESERFRRLFYLVADDAAVEAERKTLKKLVLTAEEAERTRRIGSDVFRQASESAMSKIKLQMVKEMEEQERSRRMMSSIAESAATRGSRRLSITSVLRQMDVEQERRAEEEKPSYLPDPVMEELVLVMETKERIENQVKAITEMEVERLRRMTIDESFEALAHWERAEAGKIAIALEQGERTRRIGEEVADLAASRAVSLLNLKQTVLLEEEERRRRSTLPVTPSPLVSLVMKS